MFLHKKNKQKETNVVDYKHDAVTSITSMNNMKNALMPERSRTRRKERSHRQDNEDNQRQDNEDNEEEKEEKHEGPFFSFPNQHTSSCRKDWTRISAESSLMSPRRPYRSRDWTELNRTESALVQTLQYLSGIRVYSKHWHSCERQRSHVRLATREGLTAGAMQTHW